MAIIAILSALYSACVYLVINWHHTKQSKQAEEHDSAITRLGNTPAGCWSIIMEPKALRNRQQLNVNPLRFHDLFQTFEIKIFHKIILGMRC